MTQLEIDLKSLTHNYTFLRSQWPAKTKMIAVVKANAYGLGAVKVAKHLVHLGCDYLAVAYAQEGVELRKAGIDAPIMVFYPLEENIDLLLEYQLEPALYSPAFISSIREKLVAHHLTNYPVHLKCNTGLNRIGLLENEVDNFLNELPNLPFKLISVYSHLGASEDEKPCGYTQSQIDQFQRIKSKITASMKSPPFFHLLNSSGGFNYPEAHFDAVRTGISLYGFANRAEWDQKLHPIARLSTSIVQIHSIAKGDSVGYNQGWIAQKNSLIAVLPIGHADGIHRAFGHGKGGVWIKDQWAPIVGNVCMDLIMVDVSEIPCNREDVAIIFDKNHPASSLAEKVGTISYELLAGLGKRIKRVYRH